MEINDTLFCTWDGKHVRLAIPDYMITADRNATDVARPLVGERAKVFGGNPRQWTHTVTLSRLIMAGGCDYPYATFEVADVVARRKK